MAYFYVVVIADSESDDTYMSKVNTEDTLLPMVAGLSGKKSVDRIFKVDEFGNITYYKIVFDRQLKLVEEKTNG